MNPVEIEEAVSRLAEAPFDPAEFPFAFLMAFGNKETTVRKLRKDPRSDVPGGVLQRNKIHLATCTEGNVTETLERLRTSPKTKSLKPRFLLATDGKTFEAEDRSKDEYITDDFIRLAQRFGFFFHLAGITTLQQIKDNPIDIKATSRLNKLYVELLKENPDWATEDRHHDMNHFMARLIFCFFAEDTGIFERNLFTNTLKTMTDRDSRNTHEVLHALFHTMDTPNAKRKATSWENPFPYVNGSLFSGTTDCPIFSKIARTYLLRAGELNWAEINPDIFGSMIQAIADDKERGALGMHYTSVPNIRKVLNPLFLDSLREQLEQAGNSPQKLRTLKKRLARIRVFDPACGSGNFLVIAYKDMRQIEDAINQHLGVPVPERRSGISINNFRGIELRDFAAEIARLSLIIAEFQCDEQHRGAELALAEFLPLKHDNWITCGNALRLDWLSLCPPTGKAVKLASDDLLHTPLDQSEIDFENEGGETYLCGNPPYKGSTWQSAEQKEDLKAIFGNKTKTWKSLDYVAGWFMKATEYGHVTGAEAAFVSTNSICQGQQVPILWPLLFKQGYEIGFAHTSFKWANLASHKAGVTVAIIGIRPQSSRPKTLFSLDTKGEVVRRDVPQLNAYLIPGTHVIVKKTSKPLSNLNIMDFGNKPTDGGHLLLTWDETKQLDLTDVQKKRFIKPVYGSSEYIRGTLRFCIWVPDTLKEEALQIPALQERFKKVAAMRQASPKAATQEGAKTPYKFDEVRQRGDEDIIIIPRVSSESREFLPVGLLPKNTIVTDRNFALYDAPLWNMALIASRLHWVWIGTVCVRMRTDFSYSNTLGWNTFPVPSLTEKNRADLTECAQNILLAREAHFPATIAELYDPDHMPENLRAAHEHNDEVLERIYIGRRFRNDTERLEKLFEMYTKMTRRGAA